MAVTFDASQTNHQATGATLALALTVGNNPNRLLIVQSSNGAFSITGIAGGGGAGTWTKAVSNSDNLSNNETEIWYRVGPATGAQTVTITYAGVGAPSAASCLSVYGVDQTTPVGQTGSQSGVVGLPPASFAVTLTPRTAGSICVDAFIFNDDNGIPSGGLANSEQTALYGSGITAIQVGQSYDLTNTTPLTSTWTENQGGLGSDGGSLCVAEFLARVPVATTVNLDPFSLALTMVAETPVPAVLLAGGTFTLTGGAMSLINVHQSVNLDPFTVALTFPNVTVVLAGGGSGSSWGGILGPHLGAAW